MTEKMTDSQMVSHLRTHAHWTKAQPWTDIADRLESLSQSNRYIICGESGEKDDMGLPYCIHVSPSDEADDRLVRMYRLV